jgi:thiol-disulfide isomerase/thioredoxin
MFVVSTPAYCDEIIVQGTALIEKTIYALETATVHINASESAQTGSAIEEVEEVWHAFKEHHAFVFQNEITLSEEIDEMITTITTAINDLKATCEEMVEYHDADAVHATIEHVNTLRTLIDVPVLFDFTGASCKSCLVMKQRLESVAKNVQGSARVVIIDVNSQKEYSKKFKIMLIPTLVFIDIEGNEVDRHVGEMEAQTVISQLDEMTE